MPYFDDRNYTICTSSTRPTAFAGRMIYETDTRFTLVYDSTLAAWLPPRNTKWGYYGHSTGSGTAFASLSPVQIQVDDLSINTGRRIAIEFAMLARSSVGDTIATYTIDYQQAALGWTNLRTIRQSYPIANAAATDSLQWTEHLNIAATDVYDFRVGSSRLAGTGTVTPTFVGLEIRDDGPG